MLNPLQKIFTARETVASGTTYKTIYFEKFKAEGGIIKKIATPQIYGNSHVISYPGETITKNSYKYNTRNASITFDLQQKKSLLLLHIFPDCEVIDNTNIVVPKPFLLEPKGGESITLNLNNITSIEINNIELTTLENLEVSTTTETKYAKYKVIKTTYAPAPVTYFNGYDTSKSFSTNYDNGVFDNIYQIDSTLFSVNYNKELVPKSHWGDNLKQVTYPAYCVLTPEKRAFTYNIIYNFQTTTGLNPPITITKTEYRTLETTQAFCSIKF